jgi:uroporphyrinogen-III synthase
VAKPSAEDAPLRGVGILVTRPAHQSADLVRLIEQAGGTAIRFPAIEIVPPADPAPLLDLIKRLDDFDLAIFISRNAVEHTFGWLRAERRAWPAGLRIACVGPASAQALAGAGVREVVAPPSGFDSESLLTLPDMQDVAGKRVIIFRGDGGRELLATTLKQRGALVTYAECYRRVRPVADVAPLVEAWRTGRIQIVSVTSTAGLRNLHAMLGETGRGWLLHTPVVTLSEAQAAECRRLGFARDVLVATTASDEAILEAIRMWRANGFSL